MFPKQQVSPKRRYFSTRLHVQDIIVNAVITSHLTHVLSSGYDSTYTLEQKIWL